MSFPKFGVPFCAPERIIVVETSKYAVLQYDAGKYSCRITLNLHPNLVSVFCASGWDCGDVGLGLEMQGEGTTTGLSKGDSGSLDYSSHKVCGLGVGGTCKMLICFCLFVFGPCPKRHLVVKLKQPLKGLARPHESMRGELYHFYGT